MHFVHNLLAVAAKSHQHMAAAAFQTIFAQRDADPWDDVADQLAPGSPKAGPLMSDAKAEVLALAVFPWAHWQKIWSTDPLELSRVSVSCSGLAWV